LSNKWHDEDVDLEAEQGQTGTGMGEPMTETIGGEAGNAGNERDMNQAHCRQA
jgi:hypothetical protein